MKKPGAECNQEVASRQMHRRVWRSCALLYALTFVHLVIQRCVFGARISPQQLGELWQLPSVQFMKMRPFESIIYWHAYTSGFVAYWVLLIKLFGESSAVLVYQWVNIALGASLGPAAYLIVLAAARSCAGCFGRGGARGSQSEYTDFRGLFDLRSPGNGSFNTRSWVRRLLPIKQS